MELTFGSECFKSLDCYYNLCDCLTHIGNAVPNTPQRVKFLLFSVTSQDNALQSAMGNIRADTNGLRGDLEELQYTWLKLTYTGNLQNLTGKVSAVTF